MKEFHVDNCCSWRNKLKSVFGEDLKSLLGCLSCSSTHSTEDSQKTSPEECMYERFATGFPTPIRLRQGKDQGDSITACPSGQL